MDRLLRADSDIQRDAELELRYDPALDAHDIGVGVYNRIVVLTGFVRSADERLRAEQDVKRAVGVEAIADELDVRPTSADALPPSHIAQAAVLALVSDVPYLSGVTPIVRGGEIILEGEVEWRFQQARAEEVVRGLRGVHAVINLIRVKQAFAPDDITAEIERELMRSGQLDSRHIAIQAENGWIILTGWVGSPEEREEAERAAWRAPGVRAVENRISVGAQAASGSSS
jgi:osmotically-inducible protein OsmY